ncbi:MAG TPA: glycosyltransferase [Pyrinomonadaceae bacterium]|nr:glycosyltransferase [Pyrinomonadaceae bacterium]
MAYTGTVVVIPTRNRAPIAMNAIRSVRDEAVENVEVLVSDNSTSDAERDALARFCAGLEGLRYVRPPESLSMPAHWDWAIHQALQTYGASHFLYLTDRMMFRKGGLREVVGLAARYPDKVIAYNADRIVDNSTPIRVEQYPASERLFSINTVRISQLLSQAIIHPAVPRMLNSIVPRTVLDRIQQRFGNIFASVSPDFNFCCRCLELEESILYYDKAPLFHYALSRSNGASATRGEMTEDYADFTANLRVKNANWATPIPGLNTAVNYAFHEYCVFKQETGSEKFFELDMQKYLEANANESREVVDPQLRTEMLSLLAAHGYVEAKTNGHQQSAPAVSFSKRLQAKLKRLFTGAATTPAWLFLARTVAITPPGLNSFEFATLDEAIDYARNISRGNVKRGRADEELLQARELPKQ